MPRTRFSHVGRVDHFRPLFCPPRARVLRNDATNINFSCGSWPAPWHACLKVMLWGARLKMMLRAPFSHVRALGAAQKPRFWRPPSAHQFLIGRKMNFCIFWPTSGSGPFRFPVTLFSYVATRTLISDATNINFSRGSWPAPRRALKNHAANIIFLCGSWLGHWGAHLKMELRTQFSCVWGSWALGRTLKNDAASITFSRGSWLALGRALKSDAANIIFSCESAGCCSKTKILEGRINF